MRFSSYFLPFFHTSIFFLLFIFFHTSLIFLSYLGKLYGVADFISFFLPRSSLLPWSSSPPPPISRLVSSRSALAFWTTTASIAFQVNAAACKYHERERAKERQNRDACSGGGANARVYDSRVTSAPAVTVTAVAEIENQIFRSYDDDNPGVFSFIVRYAL